MAVGQGGFYTNNTYIGSVSDVDADSLVPVDTQNPAGSPRQTLALPIGLLGQNVLTDQAVTAFAGGGQANATQLDYGFSNVNVIATNADSVKLPPAIAGSWCVITNSDAAQSLQVFGGGTSTINGVATGTGVAQAAGITALYVCMTGTGDDVAGTWFRLLSA